MIKILLTSDIHFGIIQEGFPITEDDRINTFKKITALAKEHDLLLIGGDLFDHTDIDRELIDFISEEFESIRKSDVEIIYNLGENELNGNGSPPLFLSKLKLSHLFSDLEDSPYYFSKNSQKIYIYGFPASGSSEISKIKRITKDGFHIGLFHVDFSFLDHSENSRIYRLQREDLKLLNLDFYALGHHHNFKLYKSLGRIIMAYPGSPEATSFSENEDKYVLSIIIKEDEIYQIKGFTVNSTFIKEIIIDCVKSNALEEIFQALEKNKSPKCILRIILTGKRDFKLDDHVIDKYNSDYHNIIIEDQSFPSVDLLIKEFEKENTLRGVFFNILKEKIEGKDIPPEVDMDNLSEIINRALRIGVYSTEELVCK